MMSDSSTTSVISNAAVFELYISTNSSKNKHFRAKDLFTALVSDWYRGYGDRRLPSFKPFVHEGLPGLRVGTNHECDGCEVEDTFDFVTSFRASEVGLRKKRKPLSQCWKNREG